MISFYEGVQKYDTHTKLTILVALMQGGNYRMARSVLKSILKNGRSITLTDDDLKDRDIERFLICEFNKYSDKMNASFWQTEGAMPDFRDNVYEFKVLSDEKSLELAERSNRKPSYGLKEVGDFIL